MKKKFLSKVTLFFYGVLIPATSIAKNNLHPTQTMTKGGLEKITEYLLDNIYLVIAFIGFQIVSEIIRFSHKKITKEHRVLSYLKAFFELESQPSILQNNIVFAGIGGSGKTTLINAITNPSKLGKDDETKEYLATKYSFTRGNEIYRFTLFDYRGQNTGTLARGIKDNAHDDTRQLNSIIFIVDLIKPDIEYRDVNSERFEKHSESRIKQHIEEWNDSTLNTLFGFFDQEELQYVCLFINTVDRIADNAHHIRDQIKDDLKPLIERLKKRCGYVGDQDNLGEGFSKFTILFGSAYNGLNVVKLKSELIEHSVLAQKGITYGT